MMQSENMFNIRGNICKGLNLTLNDLTENILKLKLSHSYLQILLKGASHSTMNSLIGILISIFYIAIKLVHRQG